MSARQSSNKRARDNAASDDETAPAASQQSSQTTTTKRRKAAQPTTSSAAANAAAPSVSTGAASASTSDAASAPVVRVALAPTASTASVASTASSVNDATVLATAAGAQAAVAEAVGPVAAVAERVTVASTGRIPGAAEKRARFLEKYNGKTPEEILDALSKKWRSDVYKHFLAPKIIKGANGTIIHRFVCSRYPSKHVDRVDYEDSTGNLVRHRDLCDPEETPEVEQITAYAQGVSYSPARLRYLLVMWCTRRHRPFTIVEDPEFQELMRMMYVKVQLPSRVTLARDVHTVMRVGEGRVITFLAGLDSKIHICVDGWTSPNVISFLGVTAHWHCAGEIEHIILAFIKLINGHTGKYLAEMLIECLKKFGIEKKVLAVTLDNADNNTTMLKEMHAAVPELRGPETRVRCFGHVLNLVVKAIISQFMPKRKATGDAGVQADTDANEDSDIAALNDPGDLDEEDLEAEQEADEGREAADDLLLSAMAEDHPDVVVSADDIKEGRLALEKITKLSKKVWNTPTVRAALATLANDADINSEVLVRSVATRWNTVAAVIDRALELREVLNDLCDMAQFNKPRGVRLRRFIITDGEWIILEQLHLLLDPFVYATNQISHSSRALVHEVIPFMDVLTEHVDKYIADDTLHPAVRAAAKRGRIILDKYYQLTDTTIVYRVAMILHPRYKMQYFKDQAWPEEWIKEARSITEEEWKAHYKPEGPAPPPAQPAAAAGKPGRRSAAASQAGTRELFASVTGAGKGSPLSNALEAYLEAPPLKTVTDPLKYWDLVLKSSESAGERALARMAIDFLSAPDAERAFSRGRLTVSRLRHSLSDETVRANTVVGSWARIADLLPENDVIEVIRQHASRKGDAGAGGASAADAIVLE